jgi:acyl-CoA thioesterase FadM
MPTPFEVSIHARWPDMDQNGHMRAVAYLEVAEDSRMHYFTSRATRWTPSRSTGSDRS